MLVWWIVEAVPLGVTSLLPIVLFPTLGVTDVASAAAPYGPKYVFLFMGGFLIAIALERWHLHKRFALNVLVAAGGNPRRLLGGFMVATAALSMWISNTATTLMMLPIAMSVLSNLDLKRHPNLPVALLLGTAYAAYVGGIATLVGTPPNVAMAGLLEEHSSRSVSFLEWTTMAFPFSALLLAVVYLLLAGAVPGGQDVSVCRCGRAEGGVMIWGHGLQRRNGWPWFLWRQPCCGWGVDSSRRNAEFP